MADEHFGFIKEYLPKYLSLEQQQALFETIKTDFPFSKDPYKVYRELEEKDLLYQGDAFIDIPFPSLNIESGVFELEYFKGLILSNTCDVAAENDRNYTPNVVFASVIDLSDFENHLISVKINPEKISSFIKSIRENKISSLFYLPEIKQGPKILLNESFVRFDLSTSLPLSFVIENYNFDYLGNKGDRIFTLSNYGFYLLLFKLSIHFCRFREGVFRN